MKISRFYLELADSNQFGGFPIQKYDPNRLIRPDGGGPGEDGAVTASGDSSNGKRR